MLLVLFAARHGPFQADPLGQFVSRRIKGGMSINLFEQRYC